MSGLTREQWEAIGAAAKLLGLEERASLAEIRKAYRRLARQHHPDLKHGGADTAAATAAMGEIAAAYRLLLDFCNNYRFPLSQGEDEEIAAEDWWMDRFGEDPLWGKGGE